MVIHATRLDTYEKLRAEVAEIARAKIVVSGPSPMEVDALRKGTGKGEKGKGKGKPKDGKASESPSGKCVKSNTKRQGRCVLLLRQGRAQEGRLLQAEGRA